jgi:hypothetical protein
MSAMMKRLGTNEHTLWGILFFQAVGIGQSTEQARSLANRAMERVKRSTKDFNPREGTCRWLSRLLFQEAGMGALTPSPVSTGPRG